MRVKPHRNNGSVPQSSDGKSLVSCVCAEEFSTFLVLDDGADLHSVVAVAIRADDIIGVGFIEVPLRPAGNDPFGRDIIILMAASTRGVGLVPDLFRPVSDDFFGRDIMSFMAVLTGRVDFLGRVHGLGWGNVIFVILVGRRYAVAIDAANVNLDMTVNKRLSHVVGMAHKAGCVFNCCLGGCNGRSFFLFGWFVKEQRSTRIDYKGRRSSCGFGFVSVIGAAWMSAGLDSVVGVQLRRVEEISVRSTISILERLSSIFICCPCDNIHN